MVSTRSQSQVEYGIRTGVTSMKKHIPATAASVLTMAACFLLFCSLFMISWNIKENLNSFEKDNVILAFVDDCVSQEQAKQMQPSLASIPGVKDARFISKEEAFDAYIAKFENAPINHISSSILRDRYAIQISETAVLSDVASILKQQPGIAAIRMDETITKGFQSITRTVNIIGASMTLLLAVVLCVIMYNTIHLTVMARKSEIDVMKMMGAYDKYIYIPFLSEGCITGAMAAIIASIGSVFLYKGISHMILKPSAFNILTMASVWRIELVLMPLLFVLGCCIGVAGSYLAVRKYLNPSYKAAECVTGEENKSSEG